MICADTSVWVAFLNDQDHLQVEKFKQALSDNVLGMIPAVLSELISFPKIERGDIDLISKLPMIELKIGYWQRVGNSRREILKNGLKARLADALIAQTCIDAKISLITIDDDFRHYTGLGLVLL